MWKLVEACVCEWGEEGCSWRLWWSPEARDDDGGGGPTAACSSFSPPLHTATYRVRTIYQWTLFS